MSKLWREPLLHFLVAGALLFVAFDYLGTSSTSSSDEIRVDKSALVQFLRHRDARLDNAAATAALERMTSAERSSVIEQYVREEVLFRQAVALGLEQYDYAGRRRLIAQLDYINRGFLREQLQFSDDELRDYFEANSTRYFEIPTVTFTHAFFSSERHGQKAAALAEQAIEALNRDAVPFHRGASQGDRFLYHKNYVDKGMQEVESHFGVGFAESVFAVTAPEVWIGPIQSSYGYHAVMVTRQKPGRALPFDTVRARVSSDLAAERVQAELDNYYESARTAYEVVVDLSEVNP